MCRLGINYIMIKEYYKMNTLKNLKNHVTPYCKHKFIL